MSAHHETDHYVPPYRMYFIVWAALLVLTVATVGVSYLDLKHVTVLTALIIASVKGSLVLLYFMHLRYEKPLFAYMFLAMGITYAVFVLLIF